MLMEAFGLAGIRTSPGRTARRRGYVPPSSPGTCSFASAASSNNFLFNLLVDTNETDLTYHAACCSMGTSIATMLHDMMLQIESEAVERSERGLLGLARLTWWSPIMQETYCLFA